MAAIIAAGAMTGCGKSEAPKGIDTANLDTEVSPKADFYDYACGGWMKNNPLKPEYSRFGTFDQLGEKNREQVRELVLGLDRNAAKGSNEQKVADLYDMGMDSVRLHNEGAAPLAADLSVIAATPRE
ncbi:MAG: M13 family metallopeptidase, partial [Muribaculaceae bacterium]|nr:M13 family metallopeptidase [Muribaculaceae bacterium]